MSIIAVFAFKKLMVGFSWWFIGLF